MNRATGLLRVGLLGLGSAANRITVSIPRRTSSSANCSTRRGSLGRNVSSHHMQQPAPEPSSDMNGLVHDNRKSDSSLTPPQLPTFNFAAPIVPASQPSTDDFSIRSLLPPQQAMFYFTTPVTPQSPVFNSIYAYNDGYTLETSRVLQHLNTTLDGPGYIHQGQRVLH